jgi:hypothetical protein
MSGLSQNTPAVGRTPVSAIFERISRKGKFTSGSMISRAACGPCSRRFSAYIRLMGGARLDHIAPHRKPAGDTWQNLRLERSMHGAALAKDLGGFAVETATAIGEVVE